MEQIEIQHLEFDDVPQIMPRTRIARIRRRSALIKSIWSRTPSTCSGQKRHKTSGPA